MGMSIDKAINHMKQARFDYCEFWEETRNDTTIAFDVAIEIMYKYQKIRQIVFPLQSCSTDKLNHEAIMKICEVLENDY